MYAVMRDTEYMQKDRFKENFWNDWRKLLGRNHVIQNLKDCDFTPIYDWYQSEKEKKKRMTAEVSWYTFHLTTVEIYTMRALDFGFVSNIFILFI